ncbi:MAG TPA: SlyX family protein [Spirochaetota bacterium]|nr:SlyX family protein [Spirochaetota bacterium]
MTEEERFVYLETKIAYLENFINELNEVIIEQDKTIKKISAEYDELKKQIAAGKEALPEGEKPPHY